MGGFPVSLGFQLDAAKTGFRMVPKIFRPNIGLKGTISKLAQKEVCSKRATQGAAISRLSLCPPEAVTQGLALLHADPWSETLEEASPLPSEYAVSRMDMGKLLLPPLAVANVVSPHALPNCL